MSPQGPAIIRPNYGAGKDGCEWCPEENRLAYDTDAHFNEVQAIWMVGSGKRMHRLCGGCAALPVFERLRRRKRIYRTVWPGEFVL